MRSRRLNRKSIILTLMKIFYEKKPKNLQQDAVICVETWNRGQVIDQVESSSGATRNVSALQKLEKNTY